MNTESYIDKSMIVGESANLPILYTTNCPMCKMLKQRLEEAKIPFFEESDLKKIKELGILSVPMFKVGESLMDIHGAMEWIQNSGN